MYFRQIEKWLQQIEKWLQENLDICIKLDDLDKIFEKDMVGNIKDKTIIEKRVRVII